MALKTPVIHNSAANTHEPLAPGDLISGAPVILLPKPRVRMTKAHAGSKVSIFKYPTDGTSFVSAPLATSLEVVPLDIPDELFDPLYDLRVEMVSYKRRARSTGSAQNTRGIVVSSWQGGGRHRGGLPCAHGGTPLDPAVFVSSWPVAAIGAPIHVSQGPAGRLRHVERFRLSYIDVGGVMQSLPWDAICHPTGTGDFSRGRLIIGASQAIFSPFRFALRYTVRDLTSSFSFDRLSGPASEEICCGPNILPVLRDRSQIDAQPGRWIPDSRASSPSVHFWIGSRTLS